MTDPQAQASNEASGRTIAQTGGRLVSWHTLGELVRWAALHPWPRPSDPPPPVPGRLGRDLAATRRDPVGRWAWLCVAVGLAMIGITARWPVPRGHWASYLRAGGAAS